MTSFVYRRRRRSPSVPGLLLGELHQPAADAGALGGRADRDVLDEQAVILADQHDHADHGVADDPDLAGFRCCVVVVLHRSWRLVHPP